MTRADSFLTLGLCVLTVGMISGQTRDRGTPTASGTGTARIAGRVMTTDAVPQPVRRVIVTLTGAELPGGRTAISDSEGRFAFERLPAGRFMLSGTKPSYLPGVYGATRPGRAGIPIHIGADERTEIILSLARGAAITGVLRDSTGEPAAGIDVTALQVPRPGAGSELMMTRTGTTDDRGVYRLYGLMPGEYLVASLRQVTGRISDVTALSTSQIDEALLDLQRRSGLAPRSAALPTKEIAPVGTFAYAPVFYPGTASPDGAAKITLGVGEERGGVDFTVQLTRMATIEGVLIDGGAPAKPLIINPVGLQMPGLTGNAPTYSSQTTPTGKTFKYTNVLAGRYTITAESVAPGVAWARTEVEVTADDLSGITLIMQPGLRLTGRIVFDGATLAPPPDLSVIGIRLISVHGAGTSAVGYTRMGNARIPPARVEADGRFEIAGLMPDVYRMSATVPGPAGWWLRSAIVNGADVLDHPLEVGAAGDIAGAVLTFSDRQTTLSGTIVTASGHAAPAYFIAVFPTDRALWRPHARRIQSARAGTDGTWMVRGLPAGDYFLAALSDLTAEDLFDPTVLGNLVAASVRVTLAEGEQRTQHLRITYGW